MNDYYLVAAAIVALTLYLIPNIIGVLRESGKPKQKRKTVTIGELLQA